MADYKYPHSRYVDIYVLSIMNKYRSPH